MKLNYEEVMHFIICISFNIHESNSLYDENEYFDFDGIPFISVNPKKVFGSKEDRNKCQKFGITDLQNSVSFCSEQNNHKIERSLMNEIFKFSNNIIDKNNINESNIIQGDSGNNEADKNISLEIRNTTPLIEDKKEFVIVDTSSDVGCMNTFNAFNSHNNDIVYQAERNISGHQLEKTENQNKDLDMYSFSKNFSSLLSLLGYLNPNFLNFLETNIKNIRMERNSGENHLIQFNNETKDTGIRRTILCNCNYCLTGKPDTALFIVSGQKLKNNVAYHKLRYPSKCSLDKFPFPKLSIKNQIKLHQIKNALKGLTTKHPHIYTSYVDQELENETFRTTNCEVSSSTLKKLNEGSWFTSTNENIKAVNSFLFPKVQNKPNNNSNFFSINFGTSNHKNPVAMKEKKSNIKKYFNSLIKKDHIKCKKIFPFPTIQMKTSLRYDLDNVNNIKSHNNYVSCPNIYYFTVSPTFQGLIKEKCGQLNEKIMAITHKPLEKTGFPNDKAFMKSRETIPETQIQFKIITRKKRNEASKTSITLSRETKINGLRRDTIHEMKSVSSADQEENIFYKHLKNYNVTKDRNVNIIPTKRSDTTEIENNNKMTPASYLKPPGYKMDKNRLGNNKLQKITKNQEIEYNTEECYKHTVTEQLREGRLKKVKDCSERNLGILESTTCEINSIEQRSISPNILNYITQKKEIDLNYNFDLTNIIGEANVDEKIMRS